MKTILHIIDSLGRGGAEILLVDYIQSLNDYKHIIVHLQPTNVFEEELANFQVICLNHRKKKRKNSIIKLKELISKHKVAIVHAHLLEAQIVAKRATPKNVDLVITIHNEVSDVFRRHLSKWLWNRFMYNKHQTLIYVSENAKKDYTKWINVKGKSYVLYNFIKNVYFEEKFRKNSYTSGNETFKMVVVGNLKKQKNHQFLLEALKNTNRDFELDIFGGGHLESSLEKFIKENDLGDKVRLMGVHENMHEKLKNYDLFVLASYKEGFGLAVVESMAIGLPCLLSDIKTLREVTGNHYQYFDLENESDFINKLHFCMENPDILKKQSNLARSFAENYAQRKQYVKKLRSIYENLNQ
ncbi:MAG: glycosyltransferase [Leeuwenhoekiella sp.]